MASSKPSLGASLKGIVAGVGLECEHGVVEGGILFSQFAVGGHYDVVDKVVDDSLLCGIVKLDLNLPENVLELLKSGFINIGHAKVILGLPTPELQEQAAQIIADNQLNVRQAEALCKKLAKQPGRKLTPPTPQSTLPVEVEESLKQALGNEVRVAYHDGKGKLTVHFYSDEQLKAFANLLGQYQT